MGSLSETTSSAIQDDGLTLSLAAEGGATVGAPASWLWVSKRALMIAGAARAKELYNFIFYCYIHVLLVKTNPMIYNMIYKFCSLSNMHACCQI